MSIFNNLMALIGNGSISGGKISSGNSLIKILFMLLIYLFLKAFIVYIGSNALIRSKTIYLLNNQREIKFLEALLIVIVAQSLFTG